MITRANQHWRVSASGLGLALLFACGEEVVPPPPPPPVVVTAIYDAANPCAPSMPVPNDVLLDAQGRSEAAACVTDPLEAQIAQALADEGVPLESTIRVPLDGPIDPRTISSTITFSLVASSTPSAGIPPVVVLQRIFTASATTTEGWAVLPPIPEVESTGLKVGIGTLEPASYYVVVLTDALETSEKGNKPLEAAPATTLLLGSAAISPGAYEGLDAATAARLERQRLALAPALAMLAAGSPKLDAEHIRSIHGFHTAIGPARLAQAIDRYRAAVRSGQISYQAGPVGGAITPDSLFPVGTPPARYSDILEFRKGVIKVPRFLDDQGHLTSEWSMSITIDLPFLISVPENAPRYPVAVYLAGYNRSKLDLREIANDAAKGSRTAIMGIDLRCFGDRSPDTAGACGENRTPEQVAALPDMNPNGNPEFAMTSSDGIPDSSGLGFFPGDARGVRDGQIAAILEVMHVLGMLQSGVGSVAFAAANVNPNTAQIHLIAAGQSAQIGLAAASLQQNPVETVQTPAGGLGTKAIILAGPDGLKARATPTGIDGAQLDAYLTRVEDEVLSSLSPALIGAAAYQRYVRGSNTPRLLLNFGGAPQYVPMTARQSLITSSMLPTNRQSRHNGNCDTFYVHQCRVGDNVAWLETARGQIAAFIGSGGVTVVPPAQ